MQIINNENNIRVLKTRIFLKMNLYTDLLADFYILLLSTYRLS